MKNIILFFVLMFTASQAFAATQLSTSNFVSAIIYLVIVGLIFWLFWWFVSYVGVPEPFNKIIRVLIGLAALVILCNILLGMVGQPLFRLR